MKIIYHCYGGAHSSVTAAAIHLGLLPLDSIPDRELFWAIPLYDRQEADKHGHFFLMGTDNLGNQIYVTARRSRPVVLESLFTDLAELYDIPPEDYLLVNVLHCVNWTMKLGGYLSRRWGFIKVGRPIVTMGTQLAYFRLVEQVQKVKSKVTEYGEKSDILQRQQISSGRTGWCYSYGTTKGGRGTNQ